MSIVFLQQYITSSTCFPRAGIKAITTSIGTQFNLCFPLHYLAHINGEEFLQFFLWVWSVHGKPTGGLAWPTSLHKENWLKFVQH